MWTLQSNDLPDTTQTRTRGLELLEMGDTNYRSPLFRVNALASSGFSTSEIPVDTQLSNGYEAVEDTALILTPEDELFVYTADNGSYSETSFTQIFNLGLIAEDTFLQDGDFTYFFTKASSISANLNLEELVPVPTTSLSFIFDLSTYSLDSITSVNVLGLSFSPSFSNDQLTIQGEVFCRPFPNQPANIVAVKTLNSSNTTRLTGLVFNLTSLNLDYVDKVDYQNRSFEFSSFPISGGLTYNSITKRVYLWQ